ncbi:unnamed protein product [Strongylus vulgaris]|uniref:ShKT domain-containing protein n=1 Tax=Strongylus vulgaris TaxID=40348 RepID=A0A3P7JT06_STRVU|nr:unnamed protein product [Strongylus vulgaris]
MRRYCPKTCNKCGPYVPPCRDASNNCEAWKQNGFCESTFYTQDVKKEYCEKTCGFC